MHSVHYWGAVELAKVERLVRVTNALIELQREFIEHLAQVGGDLNTATAVFDGLYVGLASCIAHRHQLRTNITVAGYAA
jgi:hypothetical protein